ncbi:MAG TPA: YdjY domain-containing protein [Planctomycetota bacterium]|nr:YdjY domain-containing protein [Planctomycetota bacterium]
MRLALLALLVTLPLVGCPNNESTDRPEPPDEKPIEHPKLKSGPPKAAPDDKPADVTSEQALKIAGEAQKGVVTALPYIKVFLNEKRIEVEGEISVKSRQLEFFACAPPCGKAYESLLFWHCKPSDLHLALLMIGLKPKPYEGRFQGGPGMGGQGEKKELSGDKVVIEIEWKDKKGNAVRRRAEDLLFDRYRQGCMRYAGFVFTGSYQADIPQPPDWETTRKAYAADKVTGTCVASTHDPEAVLDTPLAEGGDNTTYVAWEDRIPDRHTPIIAHLRPWKDGDDAEPADAKLAQGKEPPPGGWNGEEK